VLQLLAVVQDVDLIFNTTSSPGGIKSLPMCPDSVVKKLVVVVTNFDLISAFVSESEPE
jgi:hypothetical protein